MVHKDEPILVADFQWPLETPTNSVLQVLTDEGVPEAGSWRLWQELEFDPFDLPWLQFSFYWIRSSKLYYPNFQLPEGWFPFSELGLILPFSFLLPLPITSYKHLSFPFNAPLTTPISKSLRILLLDSGNSTHLTPISYLLPKPPSFNPNPASALFPKWSFWIFT